MIKHVKFKALPFSDRNVNLTNQIIQNWKVHVSSLPYNDTFMNNENEKAVKY